MEVDERDIERVALGAPAFVTADAFGDRRFTARVAELGRRMGRKKIDSPDPAERKDTQVLEVLLDLEGTPAELVSGLRVTAYVEPMR
jgi:HlyD family secretion protein